VPIAVPISVQPSCQRQIGYIEFGYPLGDSVNQRLTGRKMIRRGSGRQTCLLINSRVAQAVSAIGAQQHDGSVGDIAPTLRGVVASTCSDTPDAIEATADLGPIPMGCARLRSEVRPRPPRLPAHAPIGPSGWLQVIDGGATDEQTQEGPW
jgi:hypothetical protein